MSSPPFFSTLLLCEWHWRLLHAGFYCNHHHYISPFYLTSPLTTASLKTIRVVFPNVGGTGGASESSRYPPQCWITCRTHVNPRYFDLFIPLRTGVAAFGDRWLRVLLCDVRDGGTLEVQGFFDAGWLRGPVSEEAYLLCWRYLMTFSTLAWWKMGNFAHDSTWELAFTFVFNLRTWSRKNASKIM